MRYLAWILLIFNVTAVFAIDPPRYPYQPEYSHTWGASAPAGGLVPNWNNQTRYPAQYPPQYYAPPQQVFSGAPYDLPQTYAEPFERQNVFGGERPSNAPRPSVPHTFGAVPGPVPSYSDPGFIQGTGAYSQRDNADRLPPGYPNGYGEPIYEMNPYDDYSDYPQVGSAYPIIEFDRSPAPYGYDSGLGYRPSVAPEYLGLGW